MKRKEEVACVLEALKVAKLVDAEKEDVFQAAVERGLKAIRVQKYQENRGRCGDEFIADALRVDR